MTRKANAEWLVWNVNICAADFKVSQQISQEMGNWISIKQVKHKNAAVAAMQF